MNPYQADLWFRGQLPVCGGAGLLSKPQLRYACALMGFHKLAVRCLNIDSGEVEKGLPENPIKLETSIRGCCIQSPTCILAESGQNLAQS